MLCSFRAAVATVAGKRDELGVQCVVVDASKCPGHPRR